MSRELHMKADGNTCQIYTDLYFRKRESEKLRFIPKTRKREKKNYNVKNYEA